MPRYLHIPIREACPYLPQIDNELRPSELKALKAGKDREAYYLATLNCAQSLWLCGYPAQALLQLNFSLSENLPEESNILQQHPLPYQAKIWILKMRSEDYFLGNPVRHYQHLATRMSGKNHELREIRAWICFHLARFILPDHEFPQDEKQVVEEKLSIPSLPLLLERLKSLQRPHEATYVKSLHEQYLNG